MKKIILSALVVFPIIGFSQNDFLKDYQKAEQFLETKEIDSAFTLFTQLENDLKKEDSLYKIALWYTTTIASYLEETYRLQEQFEQSYLYGISALKSIEKGKPLFDEKFAEREYFMVKNIGVSCYGLGNFEEGKKWKERMYTAKKKKLLPEGIDQFFNYDFFKYKNKNVWGYEWYAELPKNRFSSSFTKVVYYVYDTNPDGSDKDQLYRLHVLMFHGDAKEFDYVLDKRLETASEEVSGTLYSYTYKEDIDFEQLQKDIKEVLKGNLNPDTKRITTKDKKGKTNVKIELKK